MTIAPSPVSMSSIMPLVEPPEPLQTAERTAFVVDDEEDVRSFISQILTGSGFAARKMSGCTDVIAGLIEARPDVIVLDLSLGTSDAVEVIRILASASYRGDVILTSGHDAGTLDEVVAIGRYRGLSMLPPLHKPFRVDDLRERLARVRSNRQGFEIAATLEAGLRNHWLEVWYQPKIDLKSKLYCGAEALIRLRHPQQGLLPPSAFLPPPGDPLYAQLTNFVVEQSLADWTEFARHRMTRQLAINVPASVLQRADFVTHLRAHLPDDGRFPGLIVEITEDEAIRDPHLAREISIQLRLYGVHVSIDDFGQGFSSLARLGELPFAEIKLDREFVFGCADDGGKRSMCESVAALARRFNIVAVAEGVETSRDLQTVTDLGYDIGQGYLFARPMPSADLVRSIVAHALV